MDGRRGSIRISVCATCMILCIASCSQLQPGSTLVERRSDLLRVGVTPDAPPVIYRRGERIEGLEADLARALGKELGKEVQFIELPWEEQIPSLVSGRIDIIMSGMSVTQIRRSDVAFTDPYMAGGLMALVRAKDAGEFVGPFAFITATKRVAVQTGTTGDYFVQKYMKRARRIAHDTLIEAFQTLEVGRADLMIHDAPMVWHLADEDPSSEFVVAPPRLTVEYYAWAVHLSRPQLLAEANAALDRWKANGTLDRTVRKWVARAE